MVDESEEEKPGDLPVIDVEVVVEERDAGSDRTRRRVPLFAELRSPILLRIFSLFIAVFAVWFLIGSLVALAVSFLWGLLKGRRSARMKTYQQLYSAFSLGSLLAIVGGTVGVFSPSYASSLIFKLRAQAGKWDGFSVIESLFRGRR